MKTKLLPLGNRLVLRRVDSDTVAGVRMPDVAGEDRQSQECVVVAPPRCEIEAKHTGITLFINVGDHVYIARHEGYTVQTNSGEELVVIDAEKVLCVEVDEAETAI